MSTQSSAFPDRRDADVAVIGAGPIGLEVAGACTRLGISAVVFDAGQVAQTIYDWPEETRYFSSPERMAVAGIPMQSTHQQLGSREEYLAYLRSVVEILDLDVHVYERVLSVAPAVAAPPGSANVSEDPGGFVLRTERTLIPGSGASYRVKKVVVATGDMAVPHTLGIPGEDLPHVSHYFDHPHRYFRQRLLVVGGRNSAVEAAIRAWRAGAAVALSYRRDALDIEHIYSRLHLEITLLIEKGRIAFYPETQPVEIRPGEAVLTETGSRGHTDRAVPADFVYLATGYEADTTLLRAAGVTFDPEGEVPVFNTDTMETSVPGIYVAGTAIGGNTAGYKIFVATCHDHAVKILSHAFGIDDAARIVTGTVRSRNYPFSRKDIEPE
ncbi:MAG: NAD(P)-binding domain-containing protein [bacterium]